MHEHARFAPPTCQSIFRTVNYVSFTPVLDVSRDRATTVFSYLSLSYLTTMPVQDLRANLLGVTGNMSANKSVRRCLFGMPNHEQLRRDLDAQLKSTNTELSQTWNFDFDLDKPTTGRYEWSEVDHEEYIPEFYRKGYRPTRFMKRRSVVVPETCENVDITPPASPSLVGAELRLSAESESDIEAEAKDMQRENETTPEFRPRRERQRTINEYMRVKKRRLSSEEDTEDRPSKSARR